MQAAVAAELSYKPSYRAQLIRKFGGRIPTTSEGIITGYYRPDLLPNCQPGSVPKLFQPAPHTAGNDAHMRGAAPNTKLETILCSAVGEQGQPQAQNSQYGASNREDTAKNEDTSLAAMGESGSPSEPRGLDHNPGFQSKASSIAIDVDPITLRHAYVELNFGHGYPAMPNGMPFWHKMDFEAGFAFAAFQMFLEMGESGPRELFDLCQNPELLRVAGQQFEREIAPIELNFQLQEYFILHYWYVRGRAFDLYKETALRHQRLRKQVKMEDKHYAIADTILEKLETYFLSDAFMREMSPKTAMDALSKLVAIQRVSIGLPSGGPLPINQQADATSFEMIMRNVAQTQGAGTAAGNGFGSGSNHTKDMINQVLSDPKATESLQEVVIRISTASSGKEATSERRFPGKPVRPDLAIDEATIIHAELRDLGTGVQ